MARPAEAEAPVTSESLQSKLDAIEAAIATRTDEYAAAVVSGQGDPASVQAVIDQLDADAAAVRTALSVAKRRESEADAKAMRLSNAVQAAQSKADARERQRTRLVKLADYCDRVAVLCEKRAEVTHLEREAAACMDIYLIGKLIPDARADLHSEDGIRRALAALEGGNPTLMREASQALVLEVDRLEM